MRTEDFVIGMMTFSAVFMGILTYYSDIYNVYGPATNMTTSDKFTQFNSSFEYIGNITGNIEDSIVGIGTSQGVLDWSLYQDISVLFVSSLQIMINIPVQAIIYMSMLSDLIPSIPAFVKYLFSASILFIVAWKAFLIVTRSTSEI